MLVSENVKRFLTLYTHTDLAARYHSGMELQLQPSPDGGEEIIGENGGKSWTNGLETWFPIRMPKNAKSTPEANDFELRWDICTHTLGIGMTGWQFAPEPKSRWVAYDFDKLTETSHKGTGLDPEELERVKLAAFQIPWVEVRRSTGGGGLHLYVFLGDGVPTANHTEHAALARAILNKMSALARFNFDANVDICGGNMWVWHKKMTAENDGLELIKPRMEDLKDVPANWRDYLDVVSRQRKRVNVGPGVEQYAARIAAEQLSEEHVKLIDWLWANKHTAIWEPDFNLLRCHTSALSEAAEALEYRGVFQTDATGRVKGDINCFAFPRPNGSWRVVRYGQGTSEAETWKQDGGWTFCHLNEALDPATACVVAKGIPAGKGSFDFNNVAAAQRALELLGLKPLPDIGDRPVTFKVSGGEIIAECRRNHDELAAGWGTGVKNKLRLSRQLAPAVEERAADYDDLVRKLVTTSDDEAGWAYSRRDGGWTFEKGTGDVSRVLMSEGLSRDATAAALGSTARAPWLFVNEPFQDEFLKGRRWNRDGAKLAFVPTVDDRPMSHPTFDLVLAHCGKGLDDAVRVDEWCNENGVTCGADYLRLWAVRLFKYPKSRLPYLFFYSEDNNSGKSTFHRALGLLMTKGYEMARKPLTEDFNQQLAGALLCAVEELDLSNHDEAYSRIKQYCENPMIVIRGMRMNAYTSDNYTHWVHTANTETACPVEPGDERVVAIEQVELPKPDRIPWDEPPKKDEPPNMVTRLIAEAPDFLRTLLDIEPPFCRDRLGLPVLATALKHRMMGATVVAAKPKPDAPYIEGLISLASRGAIVEAKGAGIEAAWEAAGLTPEASAERLVKVLDRTDWTSYGFDFTKDPDSHNGGFYRSLSPQGVALAAA